MSKPGSYKVIVRNRSVGPQGPVGPPGSQGDPGASYVLPPSTATALGGVMVSGSSGLSVDSSGVLGIKPASSTTVGGVLIPPGGNMQIAADGSISVSAGHFVPIADLAGSPLSASVYSGGHFGSVSPTLATIFGVRDDGGKLSGRIESSSLSGEMHRVTVDSDESSLRSIGPNVGGYPSGTVYTDQHETGLRYQSDSLTGTSLVLDDKSATLSGVSLWTDASLLTQGHANTVYVPQGKLSSDYDPYNPEYPNNSLLSFQSKGCSTYHTTGGSKYTFGGDTYLDHGFRLTEGSTRVMFVGFSGVEGSETLQVYGNSSYQAVFNPDGTTDINALNWRLGSTGDAQFQPKVTLGNGTTLSVGSVFIGHPSVGTSHGIINAIGMIWTGGTGYDLHYVANQTHNFMGFSGTTRTTVWEAGSFVTKAYMDSQYGATNQLVYTQLGTATISGWKYSGTTITSYAGYSSSGDYQRHSYNASTAAASTQWSLLSQSPSSVSIVVYDTTSGAKTVTSRVALDRTSASLSNFRPNAQVGSKIGFGGFRTDDTVTQPSGIPAGSANTTSTRMYSGHVANEYIELALESNETSSWCGFRSHPRYSMVYTDESILTQGRADSRYNPPIATASTSGTGVLQLNPINQGTVILNLTENTSIMSGGILSHGRFTLILRQPATPFTISFGAFIRLPKGFNVSTGVGQGSNEVTVIDFVSDGTTHYLRNAEIY